MTVSLKKHTRRPEPGQTVWITDSNGDLFSGLALDQDDSGEFVLVWWEDGVTRDWRYIHWGWSGELRETMEWGWTS